MAKAPRAPKPFYRQQTKCWYVQIGTKQHRLDPDQDEANRLFHELMAHRTDGPRKKGTRGDGPQPFFREAQKCWYVQIGRKQHRLHASWGEAEKLFHELMAQQPRSGAVVPQAVVAPEIHRVSQLVEDFLDWAKDNRAPATFTIYRKFLEDFTDGIDPDLSVAQLRPFHLTAVIAAHKDSWSPNTRRNFIVTVQRVFNWAEHQGLIDRTPLPRVEKPAREARELVVTPVDFAAVMAAAKTPEFRDLLTLAWETGARPAELKAIEARFVDGDRIVLPPSKSKGKKYHRVIYLGTPEAREVVARLAAAHPEGPLLRNTQGNPWTKDSIHCVFYQMKKKTGLAFHLGAFRKGFASEALKVQVDTVTLAHLMGHQDAGMVSRVYGRVQQDPAHMLEAAGRAKSARKPTGPGDASS